MNVYFPIILSLFAGLSTGVGAFSICFFKKQNIKVLTFVLALAASIMISLSIIELIPEGISGLHHSFNWLITITIALLTILIGIFITTYVERKVVTSNNQLYKIGIISMLVLMLHNFPEGIVTFMAGFTNLKLGITIAFAIALHNIPEGISIAFPIYYATNSKLKAIMYAFVSGLSEPLGALLTYLLLMPYINATNLAIMFLLVAGIMMTIALKSLLPEALSHHDNKLVLLAAIIGLFVIIISQIYL